MLIQPTIEKLNAMGFAAMAQAFTEQMNCPDMATLSFEERFGLLVDHQMTAIENRRMRNRLKNARLRLSASIEDLDFKSGRSLDRSTIMSLAQNQWVRSRHQDDQRELLEIIEERYDRKATIITSQLPIKAWHDSMQDKTLADAILDRLVHNAYKLELKGESMRRKKTTLDPEPEPVTE